MILKETLFKWKQNLRKKSKYTLVSGLCKWACTPSINLLINSIKTKNIGQNWKVGPKLFTLINEKYNEVLQSSLTHLFPI